MCDRSGQWPATVACSALLLVTPFAAFVRYQGYSFVAPELALFLAILVLAAVVLGALMSWGGTPARVLITAALIALFVDVQFDWVGAWLPLALTFAASTFACRLLEANVSRIVAPSLLAMLLISLLLPADSAVGARALSPSDASPTSGLPPRVHIILDEQVGIEGIPRAFDPDGEVAETLRHFYLGRGFRLFGRAYARYFWTADSLSNLMNFDASGVPNRHYPEAEVPSHWKLTRNAYFAEMKRRGYRIHVYQTRQFDVCDGEAGLSLASCFTYPTTSIRAIEKAPLGVGEKAMVIGEMYSRRSFLLKRLQVAYSDLVSLARERGVSLPAWQSVEMVTSVATMSLFEELEAQLAEAGPGEMFFFHLLLPHYPYSYDRDCALRPSPGEWLNLQLRGHSPEERAERYPAYLEQVECTHHMLGRLFDRMEEAGSYAGASIVIHGDHGSRLAAHNLADFEARDLVDRYSTLFAYKAPGRPAEYDRRLLSIDQIFSHLVRDGELPPGTEWADAPSVFLDRGAPARGLREAPFPDFYAGVPP